MEDAKILPLLDKSNVFFMWKLALQMHGAGEWSF